MAYDIVILTDSRYVQIEKPSTYEQNVLLEDALVQKALAKKGLKVHRTHWDNKNFDWTSARYALFRTTWDYFDKFELFNKWLKTTAKQTQFINPIELIDWNLDKHYLQDLANKGINIPTTKFIEKGSSVGLVKALESTRFETAILKPAIAGAARHTYKINADTVGRHSELFTQLIAEESMLIQDFQRQIESKGEVSLIFFGDTYSHSVLKLAKKGDFRVQDDFGGTVHDYQPNTQEIDFAKKVIGEVSPTPVYARVDILWDNNNQLALGELELIEPELWFRKNEMAANLLAEEIVKRYF